MMNGKPPRPTSAPNDFDEAAVVFFDSLAAQERRVLQLCLSNRREGRRIADAAGLDARHFGNADHRLIFAGWYLSDDFGLNTTDMLCLIRKALSDGGFWDPSAGPFYSGMWYSDATLVRMATSSLTAEECRLANAGAGDGDWVEFVIATAVTTLIDAAEAAEVWKL